MNLNLSQTTELCMTKLVVTQVTLACRIVPPGLLLGRVFKKLYFGATVSCRAIEICKIHLEELLLKVCAKSFHFA